MSRKFHFTEEEIIFIENNWKSHSDKEIALILGRTENSIYRQRKKYGWSKPNGRPTDEDKREALNESIAKTDINTLTHMQRLSLANLDKAQRVELYKQNFESNPRYQSLIEELSENELRVYIHKYVDFMDSVDTITPQEEDSLHHMIMTDINISRIRRHIRRVEEDNAEDGNPIVFGLYDTLEKAEKRFVDYQKILNVTREKRLSKDKEQRETIHTIVDTYRNKLARQEMGRQAGLMEIFKDKCKEDMSSYRYLLGGT